MFYEEFRGNGKADQVLKAVGPGWLKFSLPRQFFLYYQDYFNLIFTFFYREVPKLAGEGCTLPLGKSYRGYLLQKLPVVNVILEGHIFTDPAVGQRYVPTVRD